MGNRVSWVPDLDIAEVPPLGQGWYISPMATTKEKPKKETGKKLGVQNTKKTILFDSPSAPSATGARCMRMSFETPKAAKKKRGTPRVTTSKCRLSILPMTLRTGAVFAYTALGVGPFSRRSLRSVALHTDWEATSYLNTRTDRANEEN